MITPRLTTAIEKLARDMPRNPNVIDLVNALKEAREQVVTPLVTLPTPAQMVTRTVTPKRDRAKYMRDYRAKRAANGRQAHR